MIFYRSGQWQDGPVSMDPTGEAFKFGVGFFETLLYNGERIMHAGLHEQRLADSLAAFGIACDIPDMETLGAEAARRNGLEGSEARVNVFCPVEHGRSEPLVMAARFERPQGPFSLRVHPDPVVNPMAGHKCMNYFFHLGAHRSAMDNGFDDAVLVTPNEEILETCFAALAFRRGDTFVTPGGAGRLPSTALAVARTVLDIRPEYVSLDLRDFDACYILNTLGGMMPVNRLGDRRFEPDHHTCRTVSPAIIGKE